MSDVVEKTIAALPSIISSNLGVTTEKDWGHSRSFQAFVKHVNNIKNKHEEETALERELALQKQKLAQPNLSYSQKRESLVRILYCHMLGKDVQFAYIHAVKLAQQGAILEKRVGYLACSLLMKRDDELVMLLVNTMHKDLLSTNVLYNLAGLTAMVHMCSTEMIPAMLPLVKDKLNHPKDSVRKKAVLAMHHFLHLAPDMLLHDVSVLQKALSDRDPSVVWATLHVFSQLVPKDPGSYQYLVVGLVRLLGQVIGRKLVTDYDYHTVPAPWITLLILKLLGNLGAHDQNASQQIYPALKQVLQITESSHKMGLAVIFECLQTITHIYPYPQLINQAVGCVGKFLSAKSINLKYLGLKALVSLVTISPQCTLEHQDIVLDCLEHPDPTIQRKTLELLYKMADPSNVKVVSNKMLEFMTLTSDQVIKGDIVHKVIDLTERFSIDLVWYLETMNQVISIAENFIPDDTTQNMLFKISQGCACSGDESDPLANKQLRAAVFKLYWKLLIQSDLPETLAQVAVWVLGEYNHCVQGVTHKQVITALLHWYTKCSNDKTHCQIIAALQKMAYYITDSQSVINILKQGNNGIFSNYCYELKQRIQELEVLCACKQDVKISTNPETRVKMSELDLTLSFLDQFVCEALEKGAIPYRPQTVHGVASPSMLSSVSVSSSLNFAPYQAPLIPSRSNASSTGIESLGLVISTSSGSASGKDTRETGLRSKNKKIWSRDGVIKEATYTCRDASESIQKQKENRGEREMTPEQVKRKELAYAIFGKIPVNPQPEHQNEDLVVLSTSDSVGHLDAVPTPDTNTLRLFHSPPSSLIAGCSSQPVPSPSTDPISSPDSVLTTPDSKQSLAHLLNYDSLMSPEDQVPGNSLYHNLTMEKQSTSTNDHQGNAADLLNVETMDKVLENVPKPQSMYDDLVMSSHSGSSDDFVHQVVPEDSLTKPGENNPISPIANAMHPSPWKLLGPHRASHNYEESMDDSISIEVDSIEGDEPPSEFNVEASSDIGMDVRLLPGEMGYHTVPMLQDMDSIPMSSEKVLFENDVCICGCQKIYKTDSLVLMMYFNHKSEERDTSDDTLGPGTLEIDQNHYYITSQRLSESSPLDNAFDAKGPIEITIPSVIALWVKPLHPPGTALDITLTLPGQKDSIDITLPMNLSDFMRPLPMNVEEFGQSWTADDTTLKRTSIPILQGQGDNRGYIKVIQNMGFQLIQEIGTELLFCTKWLGMTPQVLLLHCKCGNNTVQVSVKGQQTQLVSQAISWIQQLVTASQ